ncbi:MAG: hypothetical protein LBF01_02630 [Bacteroidales bacterium]|jgi:hypothetical protein|nr:hypothetical protein [Bacteroidales bacterium]
MKKTIIVSFLGVSVFIFAFVLADTFAFANVRQQPVASSQSASPQPAPSQPTQGQRTQSTSEQSAPSFNESVVVVAPYNPVLIHQPSAPVFTPKMRDTSTIKVAPNSDYVIYSTPEKTEYSIENMKPVRISGEPIDRLFHQHLKIGFGNYLTPLAEAYFSMGRDKNYGIAASYKHLSSYGKIKGYSRYKSYFTDHELDVLGKIFTNPDFTVSLGAYYNYNQVNCYGVNDNIDTFFIENFDLSDQPQRWYQNFGFKAKFEDNAITPEQWKYTATARYNFNSSVWQSRENSVEVLGRVDKKLNYIDKHTDELRAGGIFGFDGNTYSANNSDNTSSSYIVRVEPTVYYKFLDIELRGGLRLYVFGDDALENPKAQFNPIVDFRYHIVNRVLTAFVGLTGNVERNTLEKISRVNPYLHPLGASQLDFSQDKLDFYIGLQSNISKNIDVALKGEFMLRDQILHFVQNPYLQGLHYQGFNDFIPAYSEDLFFLKASGEINFRWDERISSHIEATYNYFDKALYYVPAFEAKATFRYNIGNKFIITTDMIGYTNMTGLDRDLEEVTVKGGFDWNLGFEYRFFRRWSAFVQVNNLIAQRFFRWYDYPSYRINFIVGATFSF